MQPKCDFVESVPDPSITTDIDDLDRTSPPIMDEIDDAQEAILSTDEPEPENELFEEKNRDNDSLVVLPETVPLVEKCYQ